MSKDIYNVHVPGGTHISLILVEVKITNTVKPANSVTSVGQSPVFKGNFFLPCHRKFHMK
jgi:hypothetical protein